MQTALQSPQVEHGMRVLPPQKKPKQINVKEEVKSLHIIEENGSWLKRTECSETDAGAGSGMRKRRAAILQCSFFLIIFILFGYIKNCTVICLW